MCASACFVRGADLKLDSGRLTFLKDLGPINADQAGVGILVLLAVVHAGRLGYDYGRKVEDWRVVLGGV